MRILVLGSGGREHALVWRLSQDPGVTAIVAAPGNPGMACLASLADVNLANAEAVLALASRERIDLTVVGPETPLERGVADAFRRAGRPIVGPSARGAALECSKAFAKGFMARHRIPTARFETCDTHEAALAAVAGDRFGFPVVVKADGLAAGKGVIIAADRAEAEAAVRAAMVERRFGAAGTRLVIEECLVGPEVSFFVLADGHRAVMLTTAQDHKRIGDGDIGPNTGGMGAFAPSPLVSDALTAAIMRDVVDPVLAGLEAEGDPYCGFLYVSLMLTGAGPKVIEFNVRFGDPEAQVALPLVEGHFAELLHAAATGSLASAPTISRDRTVGVVLASAGYPGPVRSGFPIAGLDRAAAHPGVLVFHAGTRHAAGGDGSDGSDGSDKGDGGHGRDAILTAGGRVLTVVGRDTTFEGAQRRAYAAAREIAFEGMQYRRDIGDKAIG